MAKKQISVIERRLQGKSVLHADTIPIPLKEKGWQLLWGNGEIQENQIWNLVNVLGWEYVLSGDLEVAPEEFGASLRDDRVVRGIRGQEVLLKMRVSDYKAIQKKKTAENIDFTFGKKRVKADMLNTAGAQLGSEAAEYLERASRGSNFILDDSRERIGVDE
jgi:hypothetical protein